MSKKSPINVAIIGAGGIGHNHILNLQKHPSARVVAIAETNLDRAHEAASKFGIRDVETDYKRLLKRNDIDVFTVALPNYLHASVGLEVLKAKKHLLMEKPIATNARDAAKLVALAKKQRVVFMVGQNQRFTPEAQTLKRLVQQGKLGDVYQVKAKWVRQSGIPRIGSWFTQTKFAGGGCTYDIGVHALDLGLHLLGDFEPVAVSGQTFRKFGNRGLGDGSWGKSEIDSRKPFDVDDYSISLIKLKSGRTLVLEASWAAHLPVKDEFNVQLFGTDAGASLKPLELYQSGKKGPKVTLLKPGRGIVSFNRMAHFIDCVLGKTKPFVKPVESLAVQKILDAIYLSSKTGKEVRIP